jgi:hypothetical protein
VGAAADARAGPAPARNGAVAAVGSVADAEHHTSSLARTKPLAHAGADERAADADSVADADVLVHVPADEQPRAQPVRLRA